MEIMYSADGHETLHIGARLPYEGEELEQIVRMYAPVAYWQEKTRVVAPPSVGVTGAINAADEAASALTVQAAPNAPEQPMSGSSPTP